MFQRKNFISLLLFIVFLVVSGGQLLIVCTCTCRIENCKSVVCCHTGEVVCKNDIPVSDKVGMICCCNHSIEEYFYINSLFQKEDYVRIVILSLPPKIGIGSLCQGPFYTSESIVGQFVFFISDVFLSATGLRAPPIFS